MRDSLGVCCLYGLVKRDLQVAMHQKAAVLTSLSFFVLVVSLFPLGIGPEQETLRRIAPGIFWIAALLATVLSLGRLFEQDYADGSLEQLVLSPAPLSLLVFGKLTAHWLLTGLPLILLAPLLALQFGLPPGSLPVLAISLLLGTPVLSLLGSIGASLTLGLRGGSVLLTLLVVPLYVPVLIFGAGAVDAAVTGSTAESHLSLLGAMLVISLFFAPWVSAVALRIALE